MEKNFLDEIYVPGKRFTVTMEVVDPEGAKEMVAQCLDVPNHEGLTSGCKVIAVDFTDVKAEHTSLLELLRVLVIQFAKLLKIQPQELAE